MIGKERECVYKILSGDEANDIHEFVCNGNVLFLIHKLRVQVTNTMYVDIVSFKNINNKQINKLSRKPIIF